MIIKIYFYFCIYLLLLLGISHGYEIIDVTPLDSISKQYKQKENCFYERYYMCIETVDGDNCDTLAINFNGIGAVPTVKVKNDTASIIYVKYFAPSIGNYSALVNSIHSEEFQCLELDLDSIKFELKIDYFYSLAFPYMGVYISGLYQISGIDNLDNGALNYIAGRGPDNLYGVSNLAYSPYFLFLMLRTTPSKMNISNVQVTFESDVKVKAIQLDPIGKNIFDNVYDIKTYPDIKYLKNLTLMGIDSSAVLSFKSNNSALVNSYLVNVNGDAKETQTSVVSGDNTSTTYYYSLSNYGLNDLYQLFFINNGQIKDTGIKIETNITNYNFGLYTNILRNTTTFKDGLYIINLNFEANKLIDFGPLKIQLDSSLDYKRGFRFPFGFSLTSPKDGYKFDVSLLIKPYIKGLTRNTISVSPDYGLNFNDVTAPMQYSLVYDNSKIPEVYDYEYIRLYGDTFLYKIRIKAPYQFNYFETNYKYSSYGKESLVSGDLNDGVYEFVQMSSSGLSIIVKDIYDGTKSLGGSTPDYLPTMKAFLSPALVPNLPVFSVYNVSFLYNNIDVTNRRHYNEMYFNCSKEFPRDISIVMVLLDKGILANPTFLNSAPTPDSSFYAKWDESIQMFKIEFYVEANSQLGEFSFSLCISLKFINSEILDNKLIIAKSGMDFLGPMFRKIKKIIPSSTISKSGSNKIGTIGWSIEIEDPINGFDNGYFVITGELDRSMYNITINSNDVKVGGNIYLGEYDITLNISAPCISQNYIITEVVLYDRVSRKSMFSVFPPIPTYSPYMSVMNPFMYLLNDSSINKVPLSCAIDPIASLDTTPPTITYLFISRLVFDVSTSDRDIYIWFTATDFESGIKNETTPIVYFNTLNNRVLECKSTMISINDTSATYSCSISLPVSFGYPGSILISIYNLVNNNGYSSGYSSSQLSQAGFSSIIDTTFNTNEPSLRSYFGFRSTGGDLFLSGRCLDNTLKVYLVNYQNITTSITPIIISSTVIKVPNVKATDKKFKVYIKTSTFTSNTITVTPMIYDYYLPIPEPTFPPTVTPVPTNAPQSCPGKPECGGPSNGKCITNQGCVCYSPWIGIDCLSQIIVVNPPIINTGNNSNSNGSSDDNGSGSPSIEIIVPGVVNNNTNGNTTPITYSSLISIVALREININGGVVKSYTFKENWLSRQLDTLTYAFYTFIEGEDNQSTNVTAILKWFTNETTIKFANEELIMNPSSMKYTIEISNYPFQNGLNELQLVMSALIQSNTTENVCSSKEFGETTQGDNSNYLKIQVDNHSLYGRFIRRGIIDSNIRTITNTLLDKDMNPITSTTSLQSYIGIQIPNHKDLAIIDPDFSVILDSYSASSKSNSICSNKSKLSAAKIAGIAVAATAFVAVIGISAAYYFIKKNSDKKFQSHINQKMNQFNNSN